MAHGYLSKAIFEEEIKNGIQYVFGWMPHCVLGSVNVVHGELREI